MLPKEEYVAQFHSNWLQYNFKIGYNQNFLQSELALSKLVTTLRRQSYKFGRVRVYEHEWQYLVIQCFMGIKLIKLLTTVTRKNADNL